MIRFWSRSLLFYILKVTGLYYKSPVNLNYWWNFGFLALIFLIIQIVSGVFLSMFYVADCEVAFSTVYNLTNETFYGWWLRCVHANGASFFFLTVYIHMARGFYYGSYIKPRQFLWISGVIIWLLMIATAFLGYILPWGQMSFWGAMVITSLLGAIPVIGPDLIFLLWGGFSVENATLMRFYSLHFALPFIILMLTILHLTLLHEYGSSNPLGISSVSDFIPFVPYYTIKDIFSLLFILWIFVFIVTVTPDLLGHTDNYILANSLVTPPHIVPEWYFLPMYAVLRSVPNKLLGLILLVAFVVSLIILPFINKGAIIRSSMFRPIFALANWIFFLCRIIIRMNRWFTNFVTILWVGSIINILVFFSITDRIPINKYVWAINIYNICWSLKFTKRVRFIFTKNP